MASDAGRREGQCEKWLSVSWFEVASAFEVLQDAEWLVIVAGLSRLSCSITTPHPSAGRYPFAVASGADRDLRSVSRPVRCVWCRLQESNPRHPAYKAGVLPTELNRRVSAGYVSGIGKHLLHFSFPLDLEIHHLTSSSSGRRTAAS